MNYYLFITLLFFSTITINCQEDQIDFRDAFVGEYDSHIICHEWNVQDPEPKEVRNENFIMEVKKDPENQHNTIVGGHSLSIEKDGSFHAGPHEVNGYRSYSLVLANDSLELRHESGGLGGGVSCEVIGKKR